MRKKVFIPIFILVAISVLALFAYTFYLQKDATMDLRMFQSLDEFEKLTHIANQDFSTDEDRYAKGLPIQDAYLCAATYNEHSYRIYAYVFDNNATAQQYFKNITGKELQTDWSFSCNGNIFFSTQYVIYYGKCAYLVEGGDYRSFVDFVNWLSADFSLDLHMTV